MDKRLSVKQIAEKREKFLMPAYLTYYSSPIHLVKGEMQYVYDDQGKKYLDGFSAVVTISVGHCHPDIVPEVQKQNAVLQHATTLYYTEAPVRLAEKLASITPGNLQKSFFTNSGTEATEFAAVIAKNFTKRHEFLALRHSFHGRTVMSMALSGQSLWRHSVPFVFGVSHVAPAYCYRCPFGLSYPSCAMKCAYEVEEVIKYSTSGKIAALFAEPIMGFGGVITPPPEYFEIVAGIVRKYGGLLIIDEVQTGFGRTGGKWFGIEQWGVVPDVITMAKGMGNGIPIGGVITTPEIAESHRGLIHFSTFGGNPVSTTQARLVIETIEKRNYLENITVVGDYLKKKLAALGEKHPMIGEVRGMGLMLGVELVRDRKTKEPAAKETVAIMELCKDRGLLIGKGAMAGNVVRIKPPYCITKDDADFICATLDECLGIIEKGGK
ncbi:MAG: aspartate aminotransferase family protein [Candidatus Aureabacteria bacterium]|nr:aspartate aminotransferase family protein [Candidatus Auribacterota bacterium]